MSGIFHYLEKSLSCVQLSTLCDATTWVIETKLNSGQNWITEPNFLRSKSKPHPSVTSAYEQMILEQTLQTNIVTFYDFLRLRLIDDVIFNFIRNEKVTQKTHDPVDYVISCYHFIREIPDFSSCQGSSQMTPRNLFQVNWWSCSKNATTLK